MNGGYAMIEKLLTISIGKNEQPFHWHKTMELDFVLSGEADVLINNCTYHVEEGDLITVNREDMHGIENATSDLHYVQFFFNMEAYNQYISDIWTQYFTCTPKDNDVVSLNLKEEIKFYMVNIIILMEKNSKTADLEKTLISHSIEIIGCLALGFKSIAKESGIKNEEYYSRLWKIIDYMYDNSNRKLPISEVAGHVFLSEAYITKLMKESTGLSFEEFLSYIRVEDSIKYLLSSDMSVTNIAYEVGFSAPRYFNGAFVKHFKCSPKEWRERYKNFFKMDSHKESAYIFYEDGVKKQDIINLLEKYTFDGVINNNKGLNIDLKIDISENIQQRGTINAGNVFLNCEADVILSYDCMEELKACQNELGIRKINVCSNSTKLYDIAAKNVQQMGFEVLKEDELETFKCVQFNDLFSKSGIRRYEFYHRNLISKIFCPYCYINKNVLVYGYSENFNVVLFNENGYNSYLIELVGLEHENIYIIKKQHIKEGSAEMVEILDEICISDNAKKTVIQEALLPQKTTELIMKKRTSIFDISLEPKEICHFQLTKISKNKMF